MTHDSASASGTTGQPPDLPVEIVRAPTERRNPDTDDIDLLPTLEVLRRINAADATVPHAVAAVLPELAQAVELGVRAVRGGGTVHYFGAGTSGRLGTMDAAELPPTYGVSPDLVVPHHAGGDAAFVQALENSEDDAELGASAASALSPLDLAVGLAASGRTPYVAGALRRAGERGAATVLISANPGAPLGSEVDVHVGLDTGPEVIAGSTRMKAGTGQKLALNSFSTALMVRLGRTYSNLMVGMNATNAKLRGRMVTILIEATGQDERTCADALTRAGGDTRVALTSLLSGADTAAAAKAVVASAGRVREALRLLNGSGAG